MAKPIVTGSFFTIQLTNIWNGMNWNDQCKEWKEENWRALVADQHELGIDTLINLQMALWTLPLFPDPERKVGKSIKLGCPDPAMVVLDEAAKRGMKVWLGLGLWGRVSEIADYRGLSKPWPEEWFQWNRVLAETLVSRYSDMDSFAGLYLPVELSGDPEYGGTRFAEENVELYERLISESVRPVAADVPVFMSPAILQPGDYSALTKQLERLDVQTIAYQNLGKRGQSNPEDYERIDLAAEAFELLAPAHEKAGIKLWANCENFSRCVPRTWRPVTFTGEIERFKHQLRVCSPHAEKVITWVYQGVMNKQTDLVNIGPPEAQKYYDDYVAYLKEQAGN